MATVGTFATSGAVMFKAGKNVGVISELQMNQLILQAEDFVNVSTRYNWSGAYSTLAPAVKYLLEDAAASHAAVGAIGYDLGGYASTARAQTLLDINWARLMEAVKLLKERVHSDYMKGA